MQTIHRTCLSFDGLNDYIDCGAGPTFSNALTIEFWVKSRGGHGYVISRGGGSGVDGYSVYVTLDTLRVVLGSGERQRTFTYTLPATKQWKHVAFSWSQSADHATAYVDGKPQRLPNSFTASLNMPADVNLNIGRSATFNDYFNGELAELRLWNVVRSQDEISDTLSRTLDAPQTALVGYWPLTHTVLDKSGAEHNGTNHGATRQRDDTLPLFVIREPLALSLPNAESYVDCGEGPHLADAITVEAWIQSSGTGGHIVNRGGGWDDNGYSLYYTNGQLRVELQGWGNKMVVDNPLAADGAWHHVAFSWSKSSQIAIVYIDGQRQPQVGNFKYTVTMPERMNLNIGRNARHGANFVGQIADVRIWEVARSAEQIAAYMSHRLRGDETGLVGYWPFDEATHFAEDRSAGGNRGVLHGDADWISTPTLILGKPLEAEPVAPARPPSQFDQPPEPIIENAVLAFDGINSHVVCNVIDFARGNYTVEAWVKPESGDIFAATVTGFYGIRLSISADGTLRYLHRQPPGYEGGRVVTSTTSLTDGNWHHVAAVMDGQLRLFVDGVQQAAIDGAIHMVQPVEVVLGQAAANNANHRYKGLMREVRIWNVARSAAEIQAAMRSRLLGTEHGLVANWQLNSGLPQQTIVDKTNRFHATLHQTSWQASDGLSLAAPLATVNAPAPQPMPRNPAAALVGTKRNANPIALMDPNHPAWLQTLLNDIERSRNGDNLEVKPDTFTEFNPFARLGGLLISTLPLKNVELELLAAAEPGAQEAGLAISGTVDVLGWKAADIGLEFSVASDQTRTVLVKIKGRDLNMTISNLLGGVLPQEVTSVLDILGGVALSDPSIAFTNSGEDIDDDDEPFDVGISSGLNLYGKLDMQAFAADGKGELGKLLKFVAGFLGLEALTIRLTLDQTQTGLNLDLDAIIEQDITIIDGKHFGLVYKGAVVSLSMRGAPPEPSLSISNSLLLTLSFLGADDLLMTGTIAGEAESITGAYTLEATNSPWHPFNFSQISVHRMAVQIGGTYAAPWIDNVGAAAEHLTIGDVSGSLAILVDANDADNFVFLLETQYITLLQLISCFSAPVFIAYQALPAVIKTPLEKIVNVHARDVRVSIIPAATQIGEIEYNDEGITINGTLSLWGWEGSLKASVSTSMIDATGSLSPIVFNLAGLDLFSIKGALGNEYPNFRLYLGTEAIPEFHMSAAVTLLGISQSVYAELDQSGLKFVLARSLPICGYSLTAVANSGQLRAAGSMDFTLNLTLSLGGLVDVPLVDVGFNASADLTISQTFNLTLSGHVRFYGYELNVWLAINEPIGSFEDIFNALIDYLRQRASELLLSIWRTLEELADAIAAGAAWVAGNMAIVARDVYQLGEGAVSSIISASQTIGDGAVVIAGGMNEAYGWTEKQVAKALRDAGYAIGEVVEAIDEAFDLTKDAIIAALHFGGYAAEEVAQFAVDAWAWSQTQIVNALYAVGYTATEIATALQTVFNLGAEAVAIALRTVGFAAAATAAALNAVFNYGADAAAAALKAAGYAAAEIAAGIETTFQIGINAVAVVLHGVGYAADVTADALRVAFNASIDAVAVALKGVGYAADVTANALKFAFNASADVTAFALQTAGYAANEIANGLKSAFNLGVDAVAATLRGLNYTADITADALRTVFDAAADTAATALKLAGYTANEIAGGLKTAYQLGVDAVAGVLKGVGYAADVTAGALLTTFNATADVAAAALQSAGYVADEIASGLKNAYHLSADAVAVALKGIGYTADITAGALMSAFNATADGAAFALKAANYTADEIADGLRIAYQLGADAVATLLRGVGFSAEIATAALKSAFNLSAEGAAAALKAAGYAAREIASGLKTVFNFGTDAVAATLKGLGYGADVTAGALLTAFNATSDVATAALKAAGYTANEIASGLKTAYQLGTDAVAAALKGVGYGADITAAALLSAFHASADVTAFALKAAGYAADEIAGGLRSAYQLGADAVATTLRAVGYAADVTATALKTVFNIAPDGAAVALKAAGYVANEIAATLKNVFNVGIDALSTIFRGLGYGAEITAEALSSVFSVTAAGAAAALQAAGYTVDEIANGIKFAYQLSADAVAGILKGLGYGAEIVAGALVFAFNATAEGAAFALNAAGYTANEIASGLRITYQLGSGAVAGIIKGLGYGVDVATAALVAAFGATAEGAAAALNMAGYTVSEIAGGLKNVFGLGANAVAGLLRGIGSGVDLTASALQSVFGLSADGAAFALNAAGYTANEIASGLKTVYQLGADAVTGLLRGLNFGADVAANALNAVFSVSADGAATILKGAGCTVDEIANGLKVAYRLGTDAVAGILRGVGYGVDAVTGALATVFGATPQVAAAALKAAGFTASEIAKGASAVFGLGKDGVAGLLRGIRFGSETTVDALKATFGLSADAAAFALKAGGYGANAISSGLVSGYRLGEAGVAGVLKGLNFGAGATAEAIWATFGATSGTVAAALRGAGFGIDATTRALKYTFNASADSVAIALDAAGYGATQIANGVGAAFGYSAGTVASALKAVGYGVEEISDVLDDALGFGESAIEDALGVAGFAADAIGDLFGSVFGGIF